MKLPVRLPVLFGIAPLGLLLGLADPRVSPPVRPSLDVHLPKLAFGSSGMLRVMTANPDERLNLPVSFPHDGWQ